MFSLLRGPVGKARLIFAALIVGGMVAAGDAYREYRAITDPLQYDRTPCTMEACQFSSERVFRKGRTVSLFTPVVKYRYQVDGETYHGDDPAGRPVPLEGEFARQDFEAKYGPGESAVCYRDPDNPAVSVLLQESDRGELDLRTNFAVILVGLGGVGWAALEYFLLPGSRPKPRRRGVYTGLPDDVPENDALARTRAMVRDRERGYPD